MYDSRLHRVDRRKNYLALAVIFISILAIFASRGFFKRGGIVSPVPDSHTVKIIFVTPTPDPDIEASKSAEVDDSKEEEELE